jgi:energy-coupling factor transporter ATP-binding protein EcfA2
VRFTALKLANLRAIEKAEFRFKPGFNLIVGVNGVGKSTVLDALCICASRLLPSITESRARARTFAVDDIRSGLPFLDVELSLTFGCAEFQFTRRQWRDTFAVDDSENLDLLRREILNSERLRDRARTLLRELEESHGVEDSDTYSPSLVELKKAASSTTTAPNCIYFSTSRSVTSSAGASKARTAGGRSVAYADALLPRPMNVGQFADWMRVQGALGREQEVAARHLEVLQVAITRFLPGYSNLRPREENSPGLLISHTGFTLDVTQLSDGERGVLALVLDLARRLSQANPSLSDPLKESDAVVLIDEIDLHLHPKWQRQIVGKLTTAFPRCQFIATTHSPQIVAAVEPEQVLLLTAAGIVCPDRTLGMDSNWILRHLMAADDRPADAKVAVQTVEGLIRKGSFKKAREAISQAKDRGFDLPEWSVLEARMARLEVLAK